jgi:preprotein translocase subunit SecA
VAQRGAIQAWRRAALLGDDEGPSVLAEGERWVELSARLGPDEARRLERRLTLLAIDHVWSEHLGLARRIRDNIHVVGFVGKEPLAEFTREVGQAFADLPDLVDDDMVARFQALEVTESGIDWGQAGLLGPTSTWTYLVNDDPFGQNALRGLFNRRTIAIAAAAIVPPLLLLWGLILRVKNWRLKHAAGRANAVMDSSS